MSDSPTDLVCQLLDCSRPLSAVLVELSKFGWDCDKPLASLTVGHVSAMLSRYLLGDDSTEQVEQWANAVELRDDVSVDLESVVGATLHELANPALACPLTPERASTLLRRVVTSV